MSTSKLIRWGGLVVFLGGVLWGIQKIGWQLFIGDQDPFTYPQPAATILWVMGLIAALFILLGMPALYMRQAKQAGSLGLIAFVVVFTGMALVTGNTYYGVFLQAGGTSGSGSRQWFCRLAVFVDGFTLKAAEQVCAGAEASKYGDDQSTRGESVLDWENCSLLRAFTNGQPRPTFRSLPSMS